MIDTRTQAIIGVIPPEVGEAVIATRWPSVAAYGHIAQLGSDIQGRGRALVMAVIKMPLPLAILLTVPATGVAFLIALVGWLLLAPFFFVKFFPGLATRYTLTNKRLSIDRDLFFGKPSTMNPMIGLPMASLALGGWLLLLPVFLGRIFTALFLVHVMKRPAEKYAGWYHIPTFWQRLVPQESMALTELKEVNVQTANQQPFYLSADLEVVSTTGQKLRLPGVPEFGTFKRNILDAWLAWGRREGPKEQEFPGMPPK